MLAGDAAPRRARSLRRVLQASTDAPLDRPFLRPVESRRHLERLVSYLLTQPDHHGLARPSALWPGSCLPDLIGARRLRSFNPAGLAHHLPRRLAIAWEAVGLRPVPPASDAQLAAAGPVRIARAAAQATGHADLATALPAARAAAARLLFDLGLHGGQVAELVGVCDRSARRMRHSPEGPLDRCIRTRIALDDAVLRAALDQWRYRTQAAKQPRGNV